MSGARKRVAIVGASGFTGKECLRLLRGHPGVEVASVMSAREESATSVEYRGALREPRAVSFDAVALDGVDAVLACAPHETVAALMPQLLARTRTVIDLSAAFRLRDPGAYPRYYGFTHPQPELLETAVFGLTEWARAPLAGARLVANPGCYVTSVLLPLKALLAAECLDRDADVIADCKSGVSGAGKAATAVTHFASVHDDFRAYGVGTHRHEPEIREHLGYERVFFTPHLLPVFRGILSTIHVRPRRGLGARDLQAALAERYKGEPFVTIEPLGTLPCLSDVHGTNQCLIGVAAHGERCVVVSCLDNLVKGAAGQAVQNMNVVLGLPETQGLSTLGMHGGDPALLGWR